MEISGKISQANGRLLAAGLGLQIQQINNRLYLRGTLPPKPESGKSSPYQQRISTGLSATPAGLREAKRRAREIGLQLMTGTFTWDAPEQPQRIGDLIETFGRSLLAQGITETTWKKEYQSPLLRMADQPLDPDVLVKILLEETKPDTRTRKRWALAIAKLLDYAKIPNDLRQYKGSYSQKAVSPRNLPSDAQIWRAWGRLTEIDPRWGNAYGLMAVYGLRNHEVFNCDLNDFPVLWVSRGKTGERYVYPLYPEWADYVALELPNICRKDNQGYGGAVTQAFSDHGVGFSPYNLRHCWAVWAIECDLDNALAAFQMGHRLSVHNATYQHHLKRQTHQRAFEILRDNPLRPRPPSHENGHIGQIIA